MVEDVDEGDLLREGDDEVRRSRMAAESGDGGGVVVHITTCK